MEAGSLKRGSALPPIGKRIENLRMKRGFSRTQLAAIIGLSEGGLRQMETNESQEPKFSSGMKICAALGISPQHLFTGEDDGAATVVLPAPVADETRELAVRLLEMTTMMVRGAEALALATSNYKQPAAQFAPLQENKTRRKQAS